MAEKDYTINRLIRKKSYFADLINGGVFDGEQIVSGEDLELVPDQSGMIYIDRKGKKRTLQRYRDVVMKTSFGSCFVIMACETQEKVHYAMPVISVVLFLGNDWDGNKSLYDLIGMNDQKADVERIRKYLPDYPINLIQANRIEDVERFKTDLQYIFGVLKYNTEKTLLYDYVKKNQEAFKNMDSDAMMAMWSLLGEQKRLQKLMSAEEGEGRKDMCKAIDDLIADGVAKGEAKGEARGERRLSDLILTLIRQNRQDLIVKVVSDEKLRKRLYEEYHL